MPRRTSIERLSELLEPWHPFREEWRDRATLIVSADHRRGRYPCVFRGDMTLMPARSTFTVREILKGEIGRPDFDVNSGMLPDTDATGAPVRGAFPHRLVGGRTYLVFVRPSRETRAILDDPEKWFSRHTAIGGNEMVAVVDISKSREEAEAEKVTATRSGRWGEFTFTPEAWAELRASKEVDVGLQSRFIEFIGKVVLPDADLARVRSYLGAPDWHYTNADGIFYTYYLNAGLRYRPREGVQITRLELGFRRGIELTDCRVVHYAYDAAEKCLHEVRTEHFARLGLGPLSQ